MFGVFFVFFWGKTVGPFFVFFGAKKVGQFCHFLVGFLVLVSAFLI
jgi:hypothetical protein